MVFAAAPRSAMSMSRNSASSDSLLLSDRPFVPNVSGLSARRPMGVERLKGETPRFRIEPDALQRPQAIAERNQMGALRTVRTEHRGGKQNGAAGVAGVRRLLQRAEQTGRRQVAVVGLRGFGGKVPERDRHLLAKRVERGDQPLQQEAWQPGFKRDVHASVERTPRPLAQGIRRRQAPPRARPSRRNLRLAYRVPGLIAPWLAPSESRSSRPCRSRAKRRSTRRGSSPKSVLQERQTASLARPQAIAPIWGGEVPRRGRWSRAFPRL